MIRSIETIKQAATGVIRGATVTQVPEALLRALLPTHVKATAAQRPVRRPALVKVTTDPHRSVVKAEETETNADNRRKTDGVVT